MVQQGANVNIISPAGKIPLLTYAIRNQMPEVVDFLLEHAEIRVDALDEDGRAPIYYATDSATIKKLKEKEALINLAMSTKDRGTLTSVSLWAGPTCNLKQVRLFLENGASPYIGYPSLFVMAVQGVNYALVETILECGGNPFQMDDSGKVPAIVAAQYGSPKMLRLLLNHESFNPDVQDSQGVNLALAAAISEHPEKIKLIHELGILLPNPLSSEAEKQLNIVFNRHLLLKDFKFFGA